MESYSVRLSIIVPVFNVEKHLNACFDSLIDNTQTGYEIILVDDGSTDNSPSICDEYGNRHEFVRVIHKANGGLASARNAGLELASGDYYTFLDSDDFVESGYIEGLLSCIKTNNDIYAFSYFIDHNESESSTICELVELHTINTDEAVRELERCGALNVVWNKVYKRSTLLSTTMFLLDSEPGEDLIYNALCFPKAKTVSLINKPFYHWVRRGEDTLANRFRKDLFEKNMLFIDYRKKLYQALGMEESDFGLLSKGNLEYVFACVPNMYREGKKFSRNERKDFYSRILHSEEIKAWTKNAKDIRGLLKQFVVLYNLGSVLVFDMFYSLVMGVRNKFGRVWIRIRKRISQ